MSSFIVLKITEEAGERPPATVLSCSRLPVPVCLLPFAGVWEPAEDEEMLPVLQEKKLRIWLPNVEIACQLANSELYQGIV